MYSVLTSLYGEKPTTLSGKQASKVRIAVFPILAAIVMHKVPLGHILLCFSLLRNKFA